MANIKLIYFEGCPNHEKLKSALSEACIAFDEIEQTCLLDGDPLKGYSSPTILDGERLVFGCKTGDGGGGCSLEIPNLEALKAKIGVLEKSPPRRKTRLLSTIGSIGSALTVGLCPVCIPAIGAALSSVGLGFLVTESVLLPVLLAFLAVTLGGLLWSYFREHRRVGPVVCGFIAGLSLYLGRYVYFGALVNQILMYGGIAGIITVSFWNLRLRRKGKCSACVPESELSRRIS